MHSTLHSETLAKKGAEGRGHAGHTPGGQALGRGGGLEDSGEWRSHPFGEAPSRKPGAGIVITGNEVYHGRTIDAFAPVITEIL